MNKKVTISIISIFIALALIAGVTAVFMVSAQNKEEGKLAELFCKADLLYHPEVATNINVSQVPNFTDQQKADLKEQYKDKLNEFYSIRSQTRQSYIKIMDNILNTKADEKYDCFVDAGIFSYEVQDVNITGDTAKMTIMLTIWSKSITENEDKTEFYVTFPVGEQTYHVDFVKEDGVWKVMESDVFNYQMNGDYDKSAVFSSFDEAMEYANATMPENVCAKDVDTQAETETETEAEAA